MPYTSAVSGGKRLAKEVTMQGETDLVKLGFKVDIRRAHQGAAQLVEESISS